MIGADAYSTSTRSGPLWRDRSITYAAPRSSLSQSVATISNRGDVATGGEPVPCAVVRRGDALIAGTPSPRRRSGQARRQRDDTSTAYGVTPVEIFSLVSVILPPSIA